MLSGGGSSVNTSGDDVLECRGLSEGDGHFMHEESHNREDIKISRHTEEQHLQSAECWLKTQAVCKTFQPNEDTFNANVVIGNEESQEREAIEVSRHTERERKYPVKISKELSCKKSNYIELDCFGSKEPHNDENISYSRHSECNEESHSCCDGRGYFAYAQYDEEEYDVGKSKCKIAFTLAEGATHVANSNNSRKVAFTEPSRGMSGAKVEQTSAETLSFRCVCERCRLMRGEIGKPKCKAAFTLAEVLITLGIIGVVAALTIPTIIQNYKKSVIETFVKRFYTTMNQAIILSERENGDMHDWSRTPWSGDGAPTWDKYFDKYVVTVERKKTNDGRNTIFVFPDGSGVMIKASDFYYCIKADLVNGYGFSNAQCMLFGFYPNYPVDEQDCVIATYRDKGIEPYISSNVDCSKITNTNYLCENHYYGRVLQINGWKFPKDCKVKF